MTPPFTDAAIPEVCARVALALIRLEYNRAPTLSTNPAPLIRRALNRLPPKGFPIVQCALLGLQYSLLERKMSAVSWRQQAIAGSKLGYGFRLCYFNDYKANRRKQYRAKRR